MTVLKLVHLLTSNYGLGQAASQPLIYLLQKIAKHSFEHQWRPLLPKNIQLGHAVTGKELAELLVQGLQCSTVKLL